MWFSSVPLSVCLSACLSGWIYIYYPPTYPPTYTYLYIHMCVCVRARACVCQFSSGPSITGSHSPFATVVDLLRRQMLNCHLHTKHFLHINPLNEIQYSVLCTMDHCTLPDSGIFQLLHISNFCRLGKKTSCSNNIYFWEFCSTTCT